MYAAGKIPGGFIKREARPSEAAILAARLTDRPIRPLFPEGYKDDVQFVLTVLSTDQENDPDILGTIAASAALTISEIPFQGPVAAVRVGRIDGEFIVNPTISQLDESELDLVVSGTRDAIMMVEAGAKLAARGGHGRRHHVRPPGAPAAHRAPGGAAGASSARPSGCRSSSPAPSPSSTSWTRVASGQPVRGLRHGDHQPRRRSWARSSRSARCKVVKAARSRTASPRSSSPPADRRQRRSTASRTRTSRTRPAPAEAARHVPGWAGDAILVGHNVGFDLGFLEAALADGTRIEPGRYLDTLVLAREAYPDLDAHKLADLVEFFGLGVEPTTAPSPTPRPPRRC